MKRKKSLVNGLSMTDLYRRGSTELNNMCEKRKRRENPAGMDNMS
jgi:hypothetical protein